MPPSPLSLPPSTELLPALLDLSVSGVAYYLPVRDEAGQVVDFTFSYLNPAAQRLLRLPAEPATTYLQQFPGSVAAGEWAYHCDAFLAGEPCQLRQSYQADGYDSYYLVAAQRVGEGLLVSFTDTSDQPRTPVEQALRESQTREQAARAEAEARQQELQQVLAQAPVAIALFRGPRYVIELANPVACTLWGRTPEQALGTPLVELLPEAAGQGFEQLLDQVMATGEPYVAHELPFTIDRQGRRDVVYWDFVYQPLRKSDNSITAVMVVATEVTEQVLARRQAEHLSQQVEAHMHQRTQQQNLLNQILGGVPAAIATLSGPEHRFSFINAVYQELMGGRAELGHRVADVLPELAAQGYVGLLDQVYATGERYIGREQPLVLHKAAAGKLPRYVNPVYQPLLDDQGRTTGILMFVMDVTAQVAARQLAEQSQEQVQLLNEELAATNEELRTTNEELHQSNTRLSRTNTDLDTFVYTASHDLKAPITNIEGLLNALRDYLPAQPDSDVMVPRLLDMMDGAVARFLQTIGHLTDVSRLHHATNEPPAAVRLADLVNDVRLDLVPFLEVTRAQLLLDLDACPTVYFSPKNLRSIFYNLLSNALKYRDPDRDPVVEVRATCPDGQIVLEVRDNGLGLTESQQARLFALFQRLHTHVEGTGVGLYMLKRIVENAGGTITVQSQPGVGSAFIVTLPRTQPAR